MKLFDDALVREACSSCNIEDLSTATINETLMAALYLQEKSGIPFIRMDMGSPGLPINKYGVQAEIEALESGKCAVYPPADGIPEIKEAASRFLKAFVDVDVSPRSCIPTTGSVAGIFYSYLACTQRIPGKDKILLLDPGFPLYKSQLRVLGVEWRSFDLYDCRGAHKLREKLEQELASGDIAAIIYCNPDNPAWICLEEEELAVIGDLATRHDAVVIEDLAYFCMDYRHPLGKPWQAPFLPSVARYTDNYILMLSASKIFSYAGQRIALMCISDWLYKKKYPALAARYHDAGVFGVTLTTSIAYVITAGCTASTQYAYARMLELSCSGELDFVEDTRIYAQRSAAMKEIFLRHGFHVVYDRDVSEKVGDGFFFTIGYPGMSGNSLAVELIYYGVSCISLSSTGSLQQGVRCCSSLVGEQDFALLDERMAEFEKDHPLC